MSEGGYDQDWDMVREAVFFECGRSCAHCDRSHAGPNPVNQLHVHHIKPRRDGGSDNLDNLTVLCQACHSQIHAAYDGERPELPPKLLENLDWRPSGQAAVTEFSTGGNDPREEVRDDD